MNEIWSREAITFLAFLVMLLAQLRAIWILRKHSKTGAIVSGIAKADSLFTYSMVAMIIYALGIASEVMAGSPPSIIALVGCAFTLFFVWRSKTVLSNVLEQADENDAFEKLGETSYYIESYMKTMINERRITIRDKNGRVRVEIVPSPSKPRPKAKQPASIESCLKLLLTKRAFKNIAEPTLSDLKYELMEYTPQNVEHYRTWKRRLIIGKYWVALGIALVCYFAQKIAEPIAKAFKAG